MAKKKKRNIIPKFMINPTTFDAVAVEPDETGEPGMSFLSLMMQGLTQSAKLLAECGFALPEPQEWFPGWGEYEAGVSFSFYFDSESKQGPEKLFVVTCKTFSSAEEKTVIKKEMEYYRTYSEGMQGYFKIMSSFIDHLPIDGYVMPFTLGTPPPIPKDDDIRVVEGNRFSMGQGGSRLIVVIKNRVFRRTFEHGYEPVWIDNETDETLPVEESKQLESIFKAWCLRHPQPFQ